MAGIRYEDILGGERSVEPVAVVNHLQTGPDYGSGPYLALMGAAVRLARLDCDDPKHAEGAREFLGSPLVDLFAECIGFGGTFQRG